MKKIKKFIRGVLDAFINKGEIKPSFITLNIDGDLIIDGFQKLNEYNEDKISVLARNNIVYIKGEDLSLINFNKLTIQIKGEILNIEIFKVV